MIYDLVPSDHPLLYKKLEPFNFSNPEVDPIELANNLIESMVHHKGIGLSANQCGLPYRVFVMWSNPSKVCFNPKVIDQTTEEIYLDEGCLSFPHLFVKIKRPKVIKVRYQDATGESHTEKFVGMTARCFLHELDHMNGVVFTSRANPIHLERAKRQQKVIERSKKKEQHV